MSTDTELRDINVTRGEKALAVVLATFLVIGGLWMYFVPLDRDAAPVEPTPRERAAIAAGDRADASLIGARDRLDRRERAYRFAREDYRTDLDADTSTATSEPRFERARRRLDEARTDVRAAREEDRRRSPAAERARDDLAEREQAASDRAERNTALLRLAWVLLCVGAAFWLFNWLRRRRSAYFVAGVATVIAATVQALVMAGDYLGEEVALDESGPLVIAIVGTVASLLALVALQRYLVRRAPRRRVRRGQCPYCAYPLRDAGAHCEGCGRPTVAECSTCSAPRRVGTPHCAACGAA